MLMKSSHEGDKAAVLPIEVIQSAIAIPPGPVPIPFSPDKERGQVEIRQDVEVQGKTIEKDKGAADVASIRSLGSSDRNEFIHRDGHTYPEGGLQAWLVVFGAFVGMLAAFGIMNTLGVFQDYLSTHQLSSYSPSSIAWIFGVYNFLAFFCGIQIGPVFDARGPRLLILAGSVLTVGSVMLTSIATQYWHFMAAFGVMGGTGASLLFTPSISAVGHYFYERRASATGIAAAGPSAGGIVFPLMLQSLLPKLGWGWSIRILGFIILFLCVIANLLVRSRLPPKEGGSALPDFRIFREMSFTYLTVGTYFMEWGIFVPITYLISYARSSGAIDYAFSYQLLAIFNSGSFLGRYLAGYVADRSGRFNAQIVTLFFCALTAFALWTPASILPLVRPEDAGPSPAIKPLVIVYAIVFGFASGSNLSLTPVCVGQVCDTQQYGRYYATCYSVVSVGTLTGIPIAGAILESCDGNFWGVTVFTGLCYLASGAAFIEARRRRVGGLFRRAKI